MKSETEKPSRDALEAFRREQARLASLIAQLRTTIGSAPVVIDADLVDQIHSASRGPQTSTHQPHNLGAIRA